MSSDVTKKGRGNTNSRRRQRPGKRQDEEEVVLVVETVSKTSSTTTSSSTNNNNNIGYDYYYDDDEDGSDHDQKMYSSACQMGQFFLNPCLCLFTTLRFIWKYYLIQKRRILSSIQQQQQYNYNNNTNEKAITVLNIIFDIAVLLFCISSLLLSVMFFASILFPNNDYNSCCIRPYTDFDVNQIPIRIPSLDIGSSSSSSTSSDVGGWLFYNQFALPADPIDSGQPDRGRFVFSSVFGEQREILPNDDESAELNWNQYRNSKQKFSPEYDYEENNQDREHKCRVQSWAQLYNPTCNAIHEIDLMNDFPSSGRATYKDTQNIDTFYISHGYFRDVWVLNDESLNEKSILKLARWKHNKGHSLFMGILRDALVMERLTHSPRIVDIYGHCGYSVSVEAIPHEVEEYIVPGEGMIKQEELHDQDDVNPQNDYTATEKLEMALSMAESIADLHGFEDGLIVHDDIQLCQWLRTEDGSLKLGDFNRATIMNYKEKSGHYCKFKNGPGWGNVRYIYFFFVGPFSFF